MTIKLVPVTRCDLCRYYGPPLQPDHYCGHPEAATPDRTVPGDGIPTWCPLQDQADVEKMEERVQELEDALRWHRKVMWDDDHVGPEDYKLWSLLKEG